MGTELQNFLDATQVSSAEYGDARPVVWDSGKRAGTRGVDFWARAHDVIEWCKEHDVAPPVYVWATQPIVLSLDAADLVYSACDDTYEGACDNISSEKLEALQKSLDAWCEDASNELNGIEVDDSTVIVLADWHQWDSGVWLWSANVKWRCRCVVGSTTRSAAHNFCPDCKTQCPTIVVSA